MKDGGENLEGTQVDKKEARGHLYKIDGGAKADQQPRHQVGFVNRDSESSNRQPVAEGGCVWVRW